MAGGGGEARGPVTLLAFLVELEIPYLSQDNSFLGMFGLNPS